MTDDGLRRLILSVLWPGFLGASAPDWLLRARDDGLAGAVLFAHNIGSAAPLQPGDDFLIGIDEEGGSVTRVHSATGALLPSAAQLGALDDTRATEAVGRSLASLAWSVGAGAVAMPVADVNVEAANPVIGTRSFGADPALVSRHVAAAVRGVLSAGGVPIAKHFPGHGDTVIDSHHGLAVSAADTDAMERIHVPPFAAAIAAGVPAIMTGHVVTAWDSAPATLSRVTTDRLRSMGFDGVVVTDALDMDAVRRFGRGAAAVGSLLAGCDLLCLGNPDNPGSSGDDEEPFREAVAGIAAAVANGTLPLVRLEAASARVAALRGLVGAPAPFDAAAASNLAARVVAGAARACGDVRVAAPRVVVDARAAATWATSRTGIDVAGALAAGGAVVHPDAELAAAEHVVVLVDRLANAHQREVCSRVAVTHPDAVVVNLGVAPPAAVLGAGTALARLDLFGTGAATASFAAAFLSRH